MHIELEYPHFKGDYLSRSERIERFVIDTLLASDISDDARESSVAWELTHSSTCKAFMHVLADKRGLPVELARVAGALHDFYVIKTGKYKDHAKLGVPLVTEILKRDGGFSDQEISSIISMVENHSDKHIYSDDPNVELIKDVDVFDCSLYLGTEFYYLTKKPLPVCNDYFDRIIKVRDELGMKPAPEYTTLHLGNSIHSTLATMNVNDPSGYPTASLISLWALTRSADSRGVSMYSLLCKDSQLEWKSVSSNYSVDNDSDTYCYSWDEIQALYDAIPEHLTKAKTHLHSNIKSGIQFLMESMKPFWKNIQHYATLKRKLAIVARDYHCDDCFNSVLTQALADKCRSHLQLSSDLFEIPGIPHKITELQEDDRLKLDLQARFYALEQIRNYYIGKIHDLLLNVSTQVAYTFPTKEFGYTPIETNFNHWLAVGWVQFDKFEFNANEQATERQQLIDAYFNQG